MDLFEALEFLRTDDKSIVQMSPEEALKVIDTVENHIGVPLTKYQKLCLFLKLLGVCSNFCYVFTTQVFRKHQEQSHEPHEQPDSGVQSDA